MKYGEYMFKHINPLKP